MLDMPKDDERTGAGPTLGYEEAVDERETIGQAGRLGKPRTGPPSRPRNSMKDVSTGVSSIMARYSAKSMSAIPPPG